MSDTTEVSAGLTLRRAGPEDLALLRHWDAQPHIVASGAGDWGWETELFVDARWREQLIAELDGRPIGFVQVLDPAADPERYWGEVAPGLRAIDIWLGEATDLDRGLGSAIMRLAIARCFADPGVKAIVIDPIAANVRAHRFYRRLGFRPVGRRLFGDDDCLVHRLEWAEWIG